MKKYIAIFIIFSTVSWTANAQEPHKVMESVSFSKVSLLDNFWKPRVDKVSTVTLPVCIAYTEDKTGRIRNFERAGGLRAGSEHEGIYYDDSDVYKALEAIAYSLKTHPDTALERKADEWISKIAAAQEPDGYINTFYSLTGLDQRWKDMEKHEAYCAGHLIEAGIAYYNATGKRQLLDVGQRMADHMASIFGPGKRHWVAGHQEIELALVKLYRITGDQKYLNLSNWFLQERGHGHGKGKIWDDWNNPGYAQDDVPLEDVSEITGHAVRAMYYYTGAADVASYTGDTAYMKAMQRVWEDVVHRNMYITGGIGSAGHNEGFTQDYDLPNFDAYCETCASVGMVFWNQRMNQLTGDAKFVDVLERSLYNGALDGISLKGDLFFYPNPLASLGGRGRQEWFGTACCPSNIARLLASVGNYIYAQNSTDIWLNLFIGSETNIPLKGGEVCIRQETRFPWEGNVQVSIDPTKRMAFPLHIRIPGWAGEEAVPGNLYRFMQPTNEDVVLLVNGKPASFRMEKGYAVIDRQWKKGDQVDIKFPMEVRRVVSSDSIESTSNRVALQRGPLMYCMEGIDNQEQIFNMVLPDRSDLTTQMESDLLGGVVTIQGKGKVLKASADGLSVTTEDYPVKAVPYYTWANREKGAMQVWIPRKISKVMLNRE